MIKKQTLLLIFIFCPALLFAQELSKQDYLEDLDYFRKVLPNNHINLFAKFQETDFNGCVDQISRRAGKLNFESFAAALRGVLVNAGDEHTFVQQNFTRFYPIKFEEFSEGFFVTGIDKTHLIMIYGRLTSINGVDIKEVVNRFKRIYISENPSYFSMSVLMGLNNAHVLKGLDLTAGLDSVTYGITDEGGKRHNVVLGSGSKKEAEQVALSPSYQTLLRSKSQDFYWYEYNQKDEVLYFNYSKCMEMEKLPFSKFNDELFSMIESKRPRKIVLDLRGNSGGNSAVLEPFIERIKTSYLNNRRSLFVLIGKRTFSSGLMNAVEMKRGLSVTLVGEPTGGNINHFGEVRGFELPKSKLTIAYSTKYWETWPGKTGALQPDIKISYSIKNFKSGNDEAIIVIDKK